MLSIRLKHGLTTLSFDSKYVKNSSTTNSIAYRGAVLWNALGWSDETVFLDSEDIGSFLKNVVKSHAFNDFNFNVSVPQVINNRLRDLNYLTFLL